MSETLPAVPTPTDLDGWTSDDVLAHLDSFVINFKRGRLAVGLLLWKLRTLEPSDTAYGAKVAPFAEKFDVTVATLGRWRQAAEEEFGLVAALGPKNETAGQRGSVARGRATGRESKHVIDVESRGARAGATTATSAPPRDEQDRQQAQLRTDVDALVALIGRSLTAGLLAKHAKRLDGPIERPATNGRPASSFEAASVAELAALGKPRLQAVQRKIAEALRVVR